MLGWVFDLPALRSVIPGAVQMKVNAALGLVASAASLLLVTRADDPVARRLFLATAVFVLLLGTATLLEYVTGRDLGIDQLLVQDTAAAFNRVKGRMSPYSAVALVLLAAASLALPRPRLHALAQFCGGVAASIGVVSFIGYLWNATELVTDRVAPPVAVNTAVALILLGAAVILLSLSAPWASARAGASRVERLIVGGAIPTLLLIVTGGGLIYENGVGFALTSDRVAHTYRVLEELGRVRMSLNEAEAAQRGALLSGEPAARVDAAEQAAAARRHAVTLGQLVADNPEQRAHHAELAALVEARLTTLQRIAQRPGAPGTLSADQLLLEDLRNGQALRLRELTTAMEAKERALLGERLHRLETRRAATLVSLLATLAVLTAVFLLLFRSMRRETEARSEAQDKLRGLNADLERLVAERTQDLSHQQAFLRRVIDLSRNLIYAKDRDGRFVLANQTTAKAFATSMDALIGHTERELNPHDDVSAQHHETDLQAIERGQEILLPEHRVVDGHGAVRWYSTVKRPMLSADGSDTIVLCISVDITGRKQAQDEVRQLNVDLERRVAERTRDLHETNLLLDAARLGSEAASRAKSAFLANMSHEIRTPMNAVIGLTHLMLREATDGVQRDRLIKVGDAARHLLQIINDILDISKIEAGKLLLSDGEFSLEEVLSGAFGMVNTQAQDKGLELILDADDLPPRLIGDAMRLSQILINLLSNAVKFTAHGWVRLRGETLQKLDGRVEVRFEVQDTGPGIPLERQPELFNAFQQADTSTSRPQGGTGLGLALSRQLARAMGGDCGLSSAPGAGSVFWFTAWLREGQRAVPQTAPLQTKGLRALLVDDLPEALSAMADRLRHMGFEVDSLASGTAALDRVQTLMTSGRPYDVMLIDWRMTPLDGIETYGRMRSLLGAGVPPGVLVTAFDDATLASRALTAGYDAVLLKPITHSSLQDALAKVLNRSRMSQRVAPLQADNEALVRAHHHGQRVLLAEDNPVNREVAEALLRSAGLVVESAVDGARAVEMAVSRRYDLVLMDLQMPVLDGMEATRAIRHRLGQGLPIVAMTANAFAEDRVSSFDAGMNDHVTKPVDPGVLYATLLRWLPLRPGGPPTADTVTESVGPAAMPSVLDRLASIEGLDLPQALHRAAGQPAVLVRVMRRFAEVYAQGVPRLLDTAEPPAQRTLTWRAACHSMRGALGTIGAVGLLHDIDALEAGLAAEPSAARTTALGERVHREVQALAESLRQQVSE